MRYLVLISLLLLLSITGFSQGLKYDTLNDYHSFRNRKNFNDSSNFGSHSPYGSKFWVFKNKYLKNETYFDPAYCMLNMYSALNPGKPYPGNKMIDIPRSIYFKDMRLPYLSSVNPLTYDRSSSFKFHFREGIAMQDCSAQYFNISNTVFENSFYVFKSFFNSFTVKESSGYIYMSHDSLQSINFYKCRNLHLTENRLQFDTILPSNSRYSNSTLFGYENLPGSFRVHSVYFQQDSLFESLLFRQKDEQDSSHHKPSKKGDTLTISFSNTYIDCPITIEQSARYQSVIFYNCSFGPNTKMVNIKADNIRFLNCDLLPALATFIFRPISSVVNLELINSSLDQTRLLFNDSIRLYFSDTPNKDNLTNVYESLLNKFKREGKFESYQKLDIEYRNILATNGSFLDKLINTLNKYWWNYGYDKVKVVNWTLSFLAAFFLINVLVWKSMQETYPMTGESIKKGISLISMIRYYGSIFLYTCILFFSLKVDLDKLKFSRTRMVALFFFQYLVGLICLLFITSAILKI